uniref:Uncharacterized protein n=1 Tax=Strigamia maritima TaxID=126957 RepID=T1JAY0_STRMM
MSYQYHTYSNGYKNRQEPWYISNRSSMGRKTKFGAFNKSQQVRVKRIVIEKQSKNIDSGNNATRGVKAILDRKVNFFRRFIWFLIVAACTWVCVYQVGDRFILYLRNPILMKIEIMRNLTVKFPSFTICPYDINGMANIRRAQAYYAVKTKNKSMESVWNLLDYANFTSYQIWDLNQIDENEKKLPTDDYPSIIKIPKIYAFLGLCMTLKVAGSVNFMGPAFVTRFEQQFTPDIDFDDDAAFTVYPHEDDTPALHHAFFKGQIIPRGNMVSISMSVSTFILLNTTDKPCQDAVTSTKLPFMTSTARNCTTGEESRVVYDATLEMYLATKPSHCNCPPKCVDVNYEMNMDIQGKLHNVTILEIYYQTNNFQQISQVYAYGFVSFVCDVGGNLGFYFGFCLLTFLEIIDHSCVRLSNAFTLKETHLLLNRSFITTCCLLEPLQ